MNRVNNQLIGVRELDILAAIEQRSNLRGSHAIRLAGDDGEAQRIERVFDNLGNHEPDPFHRHEARMYRHAEAEPAGVGKRRAYMRRVDFLRYLRGKLTGSGQKIRGPTRHRGAIHPIESETLLS